MKRAEARLGELAARYELGPEAPDRLAQLLVALASPEAPTAVHDPAQGVDAHIADSLVALEVPEVRADARIADLGSGAGLPGVVLAIALPAARVALVESVRRKCAFLEALAERLELGNVEVVWARAEGWTSGMGAHDVVCARALAALPVLCEYAAPLLAEGGSLVAWKGRVDDEEAEAGRAAAAQLGLGPAVVHDVRPFAAAERRTLHVFRKLAPTPSAFPRRPGMAVKRPLRAGP